MRVASIAFALLVVVGSFGRASAADSGFSDVICRRRCSTWLRSVSCAGTIRRSTSTTLRRPRRTPTSGARMKSWPTDIARRSTTPIRAPPDSAVVAARALIAMGRLDDAKTELEHWRRVGAASRRLAKRDDRVPIGRPERQRDDDVERSSSFDVPRGGQGDRHGDRHRAGRDRGALARQRAAAGGAAVPPAFALSAASR